MRRAPSATAALPRWRGPAALLAALRLAAAAAGGPPGPPPGLEADVDDVSVHRVPHPRLSGAASGLAGAAAGTGKQLVVACNGFPDHRPVMVGLRPHTSSGPGPVAARAAGRRRRQPHPRRRQRAARRPAALLGLRPGGAAAAPGPFQGGPIQPSGPRSLVSRGRHHARVRGTLAVPVDVAVAWGAAVAEGSVGEALWQRPLAYGVCEEYHVDLNRKQLFFASPDGKATCEVSGLDLVDDSIPWEVNEVGFTLGHSGAAAGDADAEEEEGDDPRAAARLLGAATAPTSWPPARLAAVVAQAAAGGCRTAAVALAPRARRMWLPADAGGDGLAAELAVVDALARSGRARDEDEEEAAMDREDAEHGLETLAPVDTEAVLRLEDSIEPGAIAAEVIGSRTLTFGRAYAVEPKAPHMVLEDLRGARVLGREDASFEAGRSYVALRLGRAGDPDYPQRLLLYGVEDRAPAL